MSEQVDFYIQGSDKIIYFNGGGITFSISEMEPIGAIEKERLNREPLAVFRRRMLDQEKEKSNADPRWVVKLDFVHANLVKPMGKEITQATISYFHGSPQNWHTDLPTYEKIHYKNLWTGIDLVYNGTAKQLKYEFLLQPGADPSNITLAYRGADISLDSTGNLMIETPTSAFQDDAPIAFQVVDGRKFPVKVSYKILPENNYTFDLGHYDPNLPLVIDPAILVSCGFLGGDGYDFAFGVDVDREGNTYIAGVTTSNQTAFPEVVGPDLTHNGGMDAFVAKVKSDGSGLDYAGYIGGAWDDYVASIAVDSSGNAYLIGDTESDETSFPIKIGPDLTYNGEKDAFIAKVEPDGGGLVYAGYIGGADEDRGWDIALDSSGYAFITGETASSQVTFPILSGPDLSHNGNKDAFIAKVKEDGSGFDYSGYIGGDLNDFGRAITVNEDGSAYITGLTVSTQATFPVAVGPDLTFNGDVDVFIARVLSDGSGLNYCGYIGGDGQEESWAIALDTYGSAYISGYTESDQATFPVIIGPDLTYNGEYDAFVAKIAPDGSNLTYAGYIGGQNEDYGLGIDIDETGIAYLTGYTYSSQSSFPVLGGPDLTHNGKADAFITRVSADGSGLLNSGFIGGNLDDYAYDIALSSTNHAYVVGGTLSTEYDFPVLGGPDLTHNGDYDAFITRIFYSNFAIYIPLIWK